MSLKGSFGIDRLNEFIKENNLILLDNYSYVTRNTIISGICKTDNCNNNFKKNFRTLIRNNSFYCENCMIKIKVENRKKTHLKNCGFSVIAVFCSALLISVAGNCGLLAK